ncbi:MAG: RNA-directed DNA polymerase [Prevotella sp.]|nr:RNA-directed DNA polymerase [Prevotella sp.]
MEDKLLKMFFEPERWEYAIAKGIVKDVPKNVLYQLCKPEVRIRMYQAIANGTYEIAPPHTAKIPKDTPGEWRTVYVNEGADRVLLSIANDLLFELMPDCVHPACKSYLKGVGCGKVVQEASLAITRSEKGTVKSEQFATATPKLGWKSDLSKYFDSVPIEFIDAAFDGVELRFGESKLIDVLRKYYHSDLYIDGETHKVCSKYQSLKQGCSVASWLADVLLYHIDEKLSKLDAYYVRYSDDMLFIGKDADKAMAILTDELARMKMCLNPKKVEWLDADHWFKFLGFSIKGASISLSNSRIKKFQKEIESRTVKAKSKGKDGKWHLPSFARALNQVNRYLYHGDGQGHSWATGILGVVNVRQDIDTLNAFVMDCLRAVHTGKTKVGGLGYDKQGKVGCIVRGRGRNVTANRQKTGDTLDGYISLGCMQDAIRTSRAAYDTLVRSLSRGQAPDSLQATHQGASPHDGEATSIEMLEAAYTVYKHSIPSERTMARTPRFYALPESELSDDDMLYGVSREQAERDLEKALAGFTMPDGAGWFWQSENDPDLVVLRSWCKAA